MDKPDERHLHALPNEPAAEEEGDPAVGADEFGGRAHTGVYGVVFGRVWVSVQAAIRAMSRWTVVRSDPVRGEVHVEVKPHLGRTMRQLRIHVSLDDLGLTRVDAAFLDPTGEPDPELKQRQIARFFRRLERLLGDEPK